MDDNHMLFDILSSGFCQVEVCAMIQYCSASEFRHPSEVRHSYFMTVLKLLYYDLPANNYTLLSKASIPLFKMWTLLVLECFYSR